MNPHPRRLPASILPTRVPLPVVLLGVPVLAAVGIAAFRKRVQIANNLRLLNAKRLADRFYAVASGITKNIAYGPNPRETLDVYQPTTPGSYPVVIWVHGGSWTSGTKELYAPVAQKILPSNIVVVIPNYTIQKPRVPAGTPLVFHQAQQIANVVAWTREHIAAYNGNPNHIVIGGHSAGAHLSGLVVLDPSYLAATNHTPQEIAGWYGISGPFSLTHQVEYERNVNRREPTLLFELFGGESNFERGSPHNYARADAPPILLIHGDADETVPVSVGKNMHTTLEELGAASQLKIYPNTSHAGILFDALAQQDPQLVQDLVTFIKSCPPIADST